MFAYSIPNQRFTLVAGNTQTTFVKARFICVDGSGDACYAPPNGPAVGVSMNEAKTGEPLEVYDGLVLVEAAEGIDPGDEIDVGEDGKAILSSNSVGVGVALTSASTAGELITVKMGAVSNDGSPCLQSFFYHSEDLAAGADLTNVIIGITDVPGKLIKALIIPFGSAAGIDASNTSVFTLKAGTTTIASLTFDGTNAFPADGSYSDMANGATPVVGGTSMLKLSVTNGATADLPKFMVQVVVQS